MARVRFSFVLAGVVGALATGGCAVTAARRTAEAELASIMSGVFTSEAQARANKDYYEIRLVMTPLHAPAWSDETWLYVEQSVATSLERPYRQRVYRLRALGGDQFRSDVFALPGDPLRFTGAWTGDPLWRTIQPGDLTLREGCSIHLTRTAHGRYVGGTRGKACESRLADARYATSEVSIAPGRITSWDRGFTRDDVQAWGARGGGYQFRQVFAGTMRAPPRPPR